MPSKIKIYTKIIDSTPIQLKGHGFEWTKDNYRIKGMKTHVVYDPHLKISVCFSITAANVNDISAAKEFPIERGVTYIFDKAYYDFAWWRKISDERSYFVTRLKKNTSYQKAKELKVHGSNIISDHIVEMTSEAGKKFKKRLRVLKIKRDNGQVITLITNHLKIASSKIADLYKQRWEIELFFKWIKQHLKINRFWGKTENAVKIQIIVAMIAYLLLRLVQQKKGVMNFSIHQVAVVISDYLYQNVRLRDIFGKALKPQQHTT